MKIYNFMIDKLKLDPYEFNLLSIFLNTSIPIPLSRIEDKVSFSKTKILKTINSLKDKDLIVVEDNIDDEEVFKALSNGFEYNNGCVLCGYNKSFLDKHHYPIRAKDGGDKTISICSNCHREFHNMADYSKKYNPSVKLIKMMTQNEKDIK